MSHVTFEANLSSTLFLLQEGAIDTLISLYNRMRRQLGGNINEDGIINLSRLELFLNELGRLEDQVCRRTQVTFFLSSPLLIFPFSLFTKGLPKARGRGLERVATCGAGVA